MGKWTLIIDVEKCEDCNNCFLACKDEHVGNDWAGYTDSQPLHGHRWINILRKERGQFPLIDVAYRPTPCMHCDDAPCITAAQDNAVKKRHDGIVLIDPEKARNQKELVKSCPYGAIYWNDEKQVAQKCTFCAHLLDKGWKEPRCVQSCPTGALQVMKSENDLAQKQLETDDLRVLLPEHETHPRVYYKNLHRFDRCFITGSITEEINGVIDCVQGANVTLSADHLESRKYLTDNFGDFKFDDLEPSDNAYRLEVVYKSYSPIVETIKLKTSVNIGVLQFQ